MFILAPKSKRAKKQIEEEEEEEEVVEEEEEEPTSSKADIIKQLRAADASKIKRHLPDKNIPNSTNYEVKFSFSAFFDESIVRSGAG